MGWPGSVHDNRVIKHTPLYQFPAAHFSEKQYIIGDSAFKNQWFIVSSFNCPMGSTLSPEQEQFNTILSKARVVSEHTIGILKGRFPWLWHIRRPIRKEKSKLA